ncbi:MAG TPA: sulfite exporter TauE/SafE family protein, partial [Pseudoxanthomonas sp.]|nr:sulfite exporter TauE/SafE family protein [Pseudoxanthomonas sp.]
HLSSNVSKLGMFRGGVDKRLLLTLGVPSVVFAMLGGLATRLVATEWLEMALSIFLMALSAWMLLRPGWAIAATTRNAMLGGALSGGMAGLVGTGGAVRGLTMAAFNLPKEIFVATSAAIDLLADVGRALVYWRNGYFHGHDLMYAPLLMVIAIAGTWVGKSLLRHISQEAFRKIALGMVLLISVATLYAAARAIWQA